MNINLAMRTLILAAAMPIVIVTTGCEVFQTDQQHAAQVSALDATLRQGYSLLYATLKDESQVDKVLILKDPNPQVESLLKEIAKLTSDGQAALDGFAKVDATLDLKRQDLPELESTTRALISSATSKQVLFSGGREFEFTILLTQHQALNYITHLATAISDRETLAHRKKAMQKLSADADALHTRVITLMKTPYVGAAK